MSGISARLRRVEAAAQKLPASELEKRAAEERLRCRYTVARHGCKLLIASITGSGERSFPRDLSAEEIEELRNSHRLLHLPCASEKPYGEARAHVGRDTAEAALRDAEVVGSGDWRMFLEAEYLPLLRYEQAPVPESRTELAQMIVRKAAAVHAGHGGIGWHLDFDEEGNPPDWWSNAKTAEEIRRAEDLVTDLLEFAEALLANPNLTVEEFLAGRPG